MNKIKIVLVDDHKLFRDGLKRLLELEADIEIAGEASDGAEGINIIKKAAPDIVLFDIHMPKMNGVAMITAIRELGLKVKCIAITAFNDEGHLENLSRIGIEGYLLKSSGLIELLSAVRSVDKGQRYIDPEISGKLLDVFYENEGENNFLSYLTNREKNILYLISQGLNNSEIAIQTELSPKTVKNHVSSILKKLSVSDRTQAAVIAWKLGIAQKNYEKI